MRFQSETTPLQIVPQYCARGLIRLPTQNLQTVSLVNDVSPGFLANIYHFQTTVSCRLFPL